MYEIERKFLIHNNIEEILEDSVCLSMVHQSYLFDDGEREERIRKSENTYFKIIAKNGILKNISENKFNENPDIGSYITETEYTFTEKIGNGLKRIENEKVINKSTYDNYLKEKISNTLYKTRYFFEEDNEEVKEVIVDVYNNKTMVAEIEYKTEKTDYIPESINKYILQDVTGMKEYSNKKMAFEGV